MLIIFRSCPSCFDNLNPYINTWCCGKRCRIFTGSNCLIESVQYIFFSGLKNAIAIAHFGSGFDSLYILETLLLLGHRPKLISRGNKIIKLEYNKVICIDSYLFFHARLVIF